MLLYILMYHFVIMPTNHVTDEHDSTLLKQRRLVRCWTGARRLTVASGTVALKGTPAASNAGLS